MIPRRLPLLVLMSSASLHAESVVLRLPQPTSFEIGEEAIQPDGTAWLEGTRTPEGTTWWFGRRLTVQVQDAGSALAWLRGRVPAGTPVHALPGDLAVAEMPDPRRCLELAAALARDPRVRAAAPESRQPAETAGRFAPAPADTFFPASVANVAGQWYLENRDPVTGARRGADINVRSAWPWTRGEGVVVAVGDVGIELAHPELQRALSGAPHRNFAVPGATADPLSFGSTGAHGTSIAGLIAASTGNTQGMAGAAPDARVAAWVVFDATGRLVSDFTLSSVYRHADSLVAIQNHSWGVAGDALTGPSVLEASALESSYTQGRDGLGAIHVRVAGNRKTLGGNANDDGWGNDPRAIQVAAIRPEGRAASYSNPGASLLVAAPGGDYDTGGLFTTDLTGFAGANLLGFLPPYEYLADFRFNSLGMIGTSAAAPLVSATAALVLSVRPRLPVRDVQAILALTAVQWDSGDPDLRPNGVGLRFSHHTGFGVVDAGEAVRLARTWPLLPASESLTVDRVGPWEVADDTLRVEVFGEGVPAALASVRTLPTTGPHPDQPTGVYPLVDTGRALERPAVSLEGRAALVERGGTNYATKFRNVREAGAAFAVAYNFASGSEGDCPAGDQLCPIGGVEFVDLPAVFVSHTDGIALRDWFAAHPDSGARLALRPTTVQFEVSRNLRCEWVRLRLQTDHPLRGDLRITLRSPSGTRSVLQAYNADESAGPVDWTYSTRAPLFEPSAGTWTLEVVDEGAGAVGRILAASLRLEGVPIGDSDRDGLDDAWERRWFGGLEPVADADPDRDGLSNLREELLGSDPTRADRPEAPEIADWNPGWVRVTVPATPGAPTSIRTGFRPDALDTVVPLESSGAERTAILPVSPEGTRFVRGQSESDRP